MNGLVLYLDKEHYDKLYITGYLDIEVNTTHELKVGQLVRLVYRKTTYSEDAKPVHIQEQFLFAKVSGVLNHGTIRNRKVIFITNYHVADCDRRAAVAATRSKI